MPGSRTDSEHLGSHPVAVEAADYLWFADLALRGMARIVTELGDEMANLRPPFPGANSPYVILAHCLGVMEYWGGATVAGRSIQRDRDAEFRAAGPIAPLLERSEKARQQLAEDVLGLDAWDEPENIYPDPDNPVPYDQTKGAVLLHIIEELFQHLGQMEITRDALKARS